MTREMKRFIILMISVLLFIIMLPLTLLIAILRVLRGIINITEQTLTFFISVMREEILK